MLYTLIIIVITIFVITKYKPSIKVLRDQDNLLSRNPQQFFYLKFKADNKVQFYKICKFPS